MSNTNMDGDDTDPLMELIAIYGEIHGRDVHSLLMHMAQNPVPPAGAGPAAATIAASGKSSPPMQCELYRTDP